MGENLGSIPTIDWESCAMRIAQWMFPTIKQHYVTDLTPRLTLGWRENVNRERCTRCRPDGNPQVFHGHRDTAPSAMLTSCRDWMGLKTDSETGIAAQNLMLRGHRRRTRAALESRNIRNRTPATVLLGQRIVMASIAAGETVLNARRTGPGKLGFERLARAASSSKVGPGKRPREPLAELDANASERRKSAPKMHIGNKQKDKPVDPESHVGCQPPVAFDDVVLQDFRENFEDE